MSLVLLFLVLFYCQSRSEDVTCTSSGCVCSSSISGEPCVLNCAANMCGRGAITCRDGDDCTINCSGSDACKASIIDCPVGAPCLLNCVSHWKACQSLTVNTNTATSYQCIIASGGECPTSPPPYTAPPTPPPTQSTPSPSVQPSATPSKTPSNSPSIYSPISPSVNPTQYPSRTPLKQPTLSPIVSTINPTNAPTALPTQSPINDPTLSPINAPTLSPTPQNLTASPSSTPSDAASTTLTAQTQHPSAFPTKPPINYSISTSFTTLPSQLPTEMPSNTPSPSAMSPTQEQVTSQPSNSSTYTTGDKQDHSEDNNSNNNSDSISNVTSNLMFWVFLVITLFIVFIGGIWLKFLCRNIQKKRDLVARTVSEMTVASGELVKSRGPGFSITEIKADIDAAGRSSVVKGPGYSVGDTVGTKVLLGQGEADESLSFKAIAPPSDHKDAMQQVVRDDSNDGDHELVDVAPVPYAVDDEWAVGICSGCLQDTICKLFFDEMLLCNECGKKFDAPEAAPVVFYDAPEAIEAEADEPPPSQPQEEVEPADNAPELPLKISIMYANVSIMMEDAAEHEKADVEDAGPNSENDKDPEVKEQIPGHESGVRIAKTDPEESKVDLEAALLEEDPEDEDDLKQKEKVEIDDPNGNGVDEGANSEDDPLSGLVADDKGGDASNNAVVALNDDELDIEGMITWC